MDTELENLPNFFMVNDTQEKPEKIIEDYIKILEFHIENEDKVAITETLGDFFSEVNLWTVRQLLIDQAKTSIYSLQLLDDEESEFIEDDVDFDEFDDM